jgi:hypothetical protein
VKPGWLRRNTPPETGEIYHAIDYAISLGFAPHRDFVAGLIGERPSALLDTALARPERPLYVPGPDDNAQKILAARCERGTRQL